MVRFTDKSIVIFSLCILFIAALPMTAQSSGMSFPGITEPYRQATISASFPSAISSINKKEGSYVKRGDTIIELDYREAQLDAERCRVIAESNADLQASKLKAETAEKDFKATKILHDSTRSVSGEELWKKELEHNLARTECEKLSMAKSKEVIEHKMALERLSHYFIIAPFSGIISEHFYNEGETCRPQESLVKLVSIHTCRFITYVPAALSKGLSKGEKVNIVLEDSRKRKGKVDFVSPVVDAASGLRTVKILFDNSDGSVQPGIKGSLLLEKN